MGRLDEVRGAISRSGNTRLDMVIDVLDHIYEYFITVWDIKRYENFYDYHTSSSPKVSRKSLTDYYSKKLDYDTRSVYGRIRSIGEKADKNLRRELLKWRYKIGNEDD